MDQSSLSRPAVSCQCSRCSSSVAALENEWAKLSETRGVAPGWMSVDLFRVSISPEQKRISQLSDIVILRGRTVQEVRCRLCQQKLGVLCALDNGPVIVWKLSKVSFREIVSMKVVPPRFKEGALERIMSNCSSCEEEKDTNITVLPLTQSPEADAQGIHSLQESMTELKQDFNSLQIKLDDGGQFSADPADEHGMVTTLLLQAKLIGKLRREVAILKQENEVLKRENIYPVRESQCRDVPEILQIPLLAAESLTSEVQDLELFQRGRKRLWEDAFPAASGQRAADLFETKEGDASGGFEVDPQAKPLSAATEGPNKRLVTANDTANSSAASGAPILSTQEQIQPESPEIALDSQHRLGTQGYNQNKANNKGSHASKFTDKLLFEEAVPKRPSRRRLPGSDTVPKQKSLTEDTANASVEQQLTVNPSPSARGMEKDCDPPPPKIQAPHRGYQARSKALQLRKESQSSLGTDRSDRDLMTSGSRKQNDAGRDYDEGASAGEANIQNQQEKENRGYTMKILRTKSNGNGAVCEQEALTVRRGREVQIAMTLEEAREMETF